MENWSRGVQCREAIAVGFAIISKALPVTVSGVESKVPIVERSERSHLCCRRPFPGSAGRTKLNWPS